MSKVMCLANTLAKVYNIFQEYYEANLFIGVTKGSFDDYNHKLLNPLLKQHLYTYLLALGLEYKKIVQHPYIPFRYKDGFVYVNIFTTSDRFSGSLEDMKDSINSVFLDSVRILASYSYEFYNDYYNQLYQRLVVYCEISIASCVSLSFVHERVCTIQECRLNLCNSVSHLIGFSIPRDTPNMFSYDKKFRSDITKLVKREITYFNEFNRINNKSERKQLNEDFTITTLNRTESK